MPVLFLEHIAPFSDSIEEMRQNMNEQLRRINDYSRDAETPGTVMFVGDNGHSTRWPDHIATQSVAMGDTANEHIYIDATSLQIKDGTTVLTELTAGALQLGDQSEEHISIDTTNGLRFFAADGTTVTGQWNDTTITVGQTAAEHLNITATTLQLKDGAAVHTELTGGSLLLGNQSAEHLELNAGNIKFYGSDGTTVIGDIDGSTIKLGDQADVFTQIEPGRYRIYDGVNSRYDFNTLIGAGGVQVSINAPKIYTSAGAMQDEYFYDITTTDATATTMYVWTIPTGEAVYIRTYVTARRTGGSGGTANDSAFYNITCFGSNKSGTLSLLFNPGAATSYEDNANLACVYDTSGTDIRLRVTGDTNNNYSWTAVSEVYRVTS